MTAIDLIAEKKQKKTAPSLSLLPPPFSPFAGTLSSSKTMERTKKKESKRIRKPRQR
jgi:hypothetical protein